MTKLRVITGGVLLYPDGTKRGDAGYIVNTDAKGEEALIAGQESMLEEVADFYSTCPRDESMVGAARKESAAPAAPKASKAKKNAKRKAKKKGK